MLSDTRNFIQTKLNKWLNIHKSYPKEIIIFEPFAYNYIIEKNILKDRIKDVPIRYTSNTIVLSDLYRIIYSKSLILNIKDKWDKSW